MPVADIPTANVVLAGWLGPDRGATAPDSYLVRLWQSDPRLTATEADWVGYAAVEWSSDDWVTSDDGAIRTTTLVDFGAPSSAGSGPVRYWALHDVDTNARCYSAPLSADPVINPTAAADGHIFIRPVIPCVIG